ncbi:MAG TPA: FRG domain-containing protein [Bacteroidia bacterium]|nr:FRG domain-containing protein [Bacteroidia bacterium]
MDKDEPKVYQELEFESLNDLSAFLSQIHYRLYYRGVGNYEYSLKSKLQRVLEDNSADPNLWYFKEMHSIFYFKRNYKSLFTKFPDNNDLLSWLSLMQHYGAPTRLLDWSLSSHVALYFAYSDINPVKKTDGALWIINPKLMRNGVLDDQNDFDDDFIKTNRDLRAGVYENKKLIKKLESPEDIIERLNPIIEQVIEKNDRPFFIPIEAFYSDQRIIAQQGCFTIQCDLRQSFDEIGKEDENTTMQKQAFKFFTIGMTADAIKQSPNLCYFAKIKLPHQWKNQVMQSLNKMNITGASLFPGIAGLGIATEDYIISKGLLSSMTSFVIEHKFPAFDFQGEITEHMQIEALVKEMEKIDAEEIKQVGDNFLFQEPNYQVTLFPIDNFQFTIDKINLFFEIINIKEEKVKTQFISMFKNEIVPIANILYEKVEKEGFRAGIQASQGLKSWQNIFKIRKSLFENKIYRIHPRVQ